MLETRLIADEIMDDPALDEATYVDVVHDLAQVNGVTMAYRPTLAFLDHAIGNRKKFRLLDVGFGDGDMLRRIALWAEKRGIKTDLVGVDLNPRSLAAARDATPDGSPIDYRIGDYADLARPNDGDGWDCIISSLVAHHMTREQLAAFLRFMDAEARAGWLVNDLHRHILAYAGFPMLAAIMRWHRVVKHDGHMSIARSYRAAEWPLILAEADVQDARVFRVFPFRLCVEKIR